MATSSPPPARRVLVVGIDAMTWWMVEEGIADGRLPNLRGLLRRSTVARLDDSRGFRTGLVWEQFLTGRSPDGVGRAQAVEYDPMTYRAHQVGAVAPPFFAGPGGPRTVAFDVPYLSTAFAASGAVVAAWGAHDPGHARGSSPAGLLAEIDARFGPHPACGNDYQVVWHRADWVERLGAALARGAAQRPAIVRWLQDRVPDWELCIMSFSELHSASEMFWHGVDPAHPLAAFPTAVAARGWLLAVYDAIDVALGELLKATSPDDYVVAFATHGMGTNTSDIPSMVLLPELLHRLERGAPLLRNPPGPPPRPGDPVPVIPPDATWAEMIDRNLPGRADRALRKLGHRVAPVAGARLYRRLTGQPTAHLAGPVVAPGLFGVPVRGETADHETRSTMAWHHAKRYERYWPEMHAFVLPGFYDAAVRLNVVGRERQGLVPAHEYGAWCDRLEAMLRGLRNPYTGNPVVAEVERPRGADPFAASSSAGDLVISWAEPACALEHPEIGVVGPYPIRRPGAHSEPLGFAAMAGPGLPATHVGTRLPPDVPATVLALLGHAPGQGMEGTPIVGAQALAAD